MTSLRTKGKSTIVWILMGLLLLGLGGFGVTSFSGGSTEIGAVGETEIDSQTYYNSLQGQMDNFSRQTGQRMTIDQARGIGLTQAVQAHSPDVLNALADFYDSLDAGQQQKVRELMQRRKGWMARG